jgi:hypothetical protein
MQAPSPESAPPSAEMVAQQQPAYLTRLATLPERHEVSAASDALQPQYRPDARRLDQIEHALTILASVVARLGKEAQQTRLQLRATEHDPGLSEERRVQRELVRSMQARLDHMEERFARQVSSSVPAAIVPSHEVSEQLSASLNSIRDSLASLAKRRKRPGPLSVE